MFRRASPAVIFKPFRLGRIAIVNEQGWTREPVFFSSLLRQNPSRMRLNVYCSVSYSKYLAYWGKFTVYFTNLPVILVSKLLLRRQNFYYHSLGRIRHERDSSGEASWLHCYHCFFRFINMIWLIWLDVFMSRQASNALLNIVCDIMSSLSDFLCDFPVIKSCCMGNNCDRRIPMWRLTNNCFHFC